MGRLTGSTAIVFGGGVAGDHPELGSIGATTATTLARHGARVAVVDRDPDAAGRTVAMIRAGGGDALAVTADVTDGDQVEHAVDLAAHRFDGLDLACHVVGSARLGGVEEMDLQDWRASVSLNLDSVFLTARAVLPRLLERGGAIVNISSIASVRWTGYAYPAYAAAKAGVNQLTRTLAAQYADRGVRVNAVLAGVIDTPLVYRDLAGDEPAADVRARRDRMSPTGRSGTAQHVADAVAFLLSDEAAYVTGVLLPVDGGLHARAC